MRNGKYDLVVAPKDYPGQLYRNRYCYLHHLIYWQHTGIVPTKDEIIHHIDGNTRNNNIENLEIMDRVKHIIFHDSKRERKKVLLRCPVCAKKFIRNKNQTHLQKKGIATYCSTSCKNKANSLRAKNDKLFLYNVSHNVISQFSQ